MMGTVLGVFWDSVCIAKSSKTFPNHLKMEQDTKYFSVSNICSILINRS